MTALAVVAACATLAVIILALRRPVFARIAVRGATRRKTETVLVVAGSLLGTAIITGSLVVGETLDASVRAGASNQLGPVDLVVRGVTPRAASSAADALAGVDGEHIDGVIAILRTSASVATGTVGQRLAAPRAQLLEVDFADARASGTTPRPRASAARVPGPDRSSSGRTWQPTSGPVQATS